MLAATYANRTVEAQEQVRCVITLSVHSASKSGINTVRVLMRTKLTRKIIVKSAVLYQNTLVNLMLTIRMVIT
ncbi:hypothetical protein SBP1_gp014 [Vibrio virus vB_VspP_SBP1]|uniref:Uncharacterized protein n=1 Tax=Vibrio virus vB_VspP_SBP1 TaxID=2500581 RepID=A0A3T0IIF4_9CAUD|nr:hypothetical protein KNU36_gp014 [Vibrio virus vB_VspP_SBP1]AZU99606.1 hypothetical protein SBP1_gp014 [Vibrio virus vB_VspP_SBP1]